MKTDSIRSLLFSRESALAALVFLSTLALFSPAVGYDFVGLDDEPYVSRNPMTRDGFSAESLKWACTADVVGHWAPLLWMSYMLDGTLYGPGPAGFHFTNILLHAVNAALVFLLLRRWTGAKGAALWGALFWAWHPLRVESVAWITERKDVLSGLFFLLCAGSYVRGVRDRRGWGWRTGLPAFFLGAGLLVKPVLVTVPFVLLLLDAWPLRRLGGGGRVLAARVAEKWPFWLLAAGLGAVSWQVNAAAGIPHADMPPLADRLLAVPGNYLVYLRQAVWPGILAALYPRPVFSPAATGVALAVLGGIGAAAWASRRTRPGAAVGGLWFAGMLVPSIGLVWMGTTEGAGDRFTYLPAIGLSLLAVSWLDGHLRGRGLWAAAGAATLLAAAIGTARQLPVWKNSGTLYARVLEVSPFHLQANLNYGIWLQEEGRTEEAQEHYRHAAAHSAKGPETLGAAGYGWVLEGRAREAKSLLEPALADPRAPALVHGAYGMACLHLGDVSSAVRHLERALERDPADAEFRLELIRAHFEAGEAEEARRQAALLKGWPDGEIRDAADLFPFYVQRWRNGEKKYAWGYFERRVDAAPDSVPLLNNLAWLAATDGASPPEALAAAVEYAERAVRLTEGKSAAAMDTLAAAQAARGDFAGAAETARKAAERAAEEGDGALRENIRSRIRGYEEGRRPPP